MQLQLSLGTLLLIYKCFQIGSWFGKGKRLLCFLSVSMSVIVITIFNPFPNYKFYLKEFANDNLKFGENGRKFSKRVENTVGNGEIGSLLAISPFPILFSKDLYCRHVITRACLGKGYHTIFTVWQNFGPNQIDNIYKWHNVVQIMNSVRDMGRKYCGKRRKKCCLPTLYFSHSFFWKAFFFAVVKKTGLFGK